MNLGSFVKIGLVIAAGLAVVNSNFWAEQVEDRLKVERKPGFGFDDLVDAAGITAVFFLAKKFLPGA